MYDLVELKMFGTAFVYSVFGRANNEKHNYSLEQRGFIFWCKAS